MFGFFKKSPPQIVKKNIDSIIILPKQFDILKKINFKDFKTLNDISDETKLHKNIIGFFFQYEALGNMRLINFSKDGDIDYSFLDHVFGESIGDMEDSCLFLTLWLQVSQDVLIRLLYHSEEEEMKKYQSLERVFIERGYPIELHDDHSLKKEIKVTLMEGNVLYYENIYYKPRNPRIHLRLKEMLFTNITTKKSSKRCYNYDGKKISTTNKYSDKGFKENYNWSEIFNLFETKV